MERVKITSFGQRPPPIFNVDYLKDLESEVKNWINYVNVVFVRALNVKNHISKKFCLVVVYFWLLDIKFDKDLIAYFSAA